MLLLRTDVGKEGIMSLGKIDTKSKRLVAIGKCRSTGLVSTDDNLAKSLDRIQRIYTTSSTEPSIYASHYLHLLRSKALRLDFFEVVELSRISIATQLNAYLEARYKYKILPELKLLDRYPPCVQLEVSSICNYRCKMCFQVDESFSTKKSPHMGTMTLETFRKAVDELEGQVDSVTIASRGEPLMAPDFREMMSYISGKFMCFKINTNLSLMTEDIARSLLLARPQTIVFSVDSGDPELYEEIRVNGRYKRMYDKLKLFHSIYKELNSSTIVRISGVAVDQRQSTEQLYETFSEFADLFSLSECTPWSSSYANPINSIIKPCNDLWRRLFIWWDGTVNPCDYDYKSNLAIGNINQSSISELWHSTEYNNLRNSHLDGQRSNHYPCDRCPIV